MGKKYGRWSSKMEFPHLHHAIFVDIETDTDMKRVWLIGVKLEEVEEQFLAKNWLGEAQILHDFTIFLAEHPTKPLICYSTTNFDFRILQSAAKRLGASKLEEQLNKRALIDMGTLLRRHYSPYGRSYSLKLLRFLIGYNYTDLSMNGEEVAIKYYQQVKGLGKITEEFAEKAKVYNLDDIRILYDMIGKFQEHIKFTSNYTRSTKLHEIENLIKSRVYSSNFNDNYIRLSVYNKDANSIMQKLMQHGLPLPVVKIGVNVTALYWRSNFSLSQMQNLLNNINLELSE